MSEDYTVEPYVLVDSSADWTDQASRLATARTRLLDAPTTGFPGRVAQHAATWAASWSTVVGDLADRAEGIAEELSSAVDAYTLADVDAQERFESWMDGAP